MDEPAMAAATVSTGTSFLYLLIPLLIIAALFYFLVIRRK